MMEKRKVWPCSKMQQNATNGTKLHSYLTKMREKRKVGATAFSSSIRILSQRVCCYRKRKVKATDYSSAIRFLRQSMHLYRKQQEAPTIQQCDYPRTRLTKEL